MKGFSMINLRGFPPTSTIRSLRLRGPKIAYQPQALCQRVEVVELEGQRLITCQERALHTLRASSQDYQKHNAESESIKPTILNPCQMYHRIQNQIQTDVRQQTQVIDKYNTLEKTHQHFFHSQTMQCSTCSYTHNCWKCGTQLKPIDEQYFCDCGMIQPPNQKRHYFDVLNLPMQFEVDEHEMSRNYKHLQTLLHPDKFSTKSQEEIDFAVEQSTVVNKAYKKLKDKMSRGVYLLKLHGLDIEKGTEKETDPMLLMEVMELNERLAEISNAEELKDFANSNQEQMDTLFSELSEAFKELDLHSAHTILHKLKYLNNIAEKISELEYKFIDD